MSDETLLQEILAGQQKILDRLESATTNDELIKAIGHVHSELEEQKKRQFSFSEWLGSFGNELTLSNHW